MRYSGGASNDILGPGNGSVANAIAHYGGPGHVGSDHLWPRRYDQTNPLSKDHLWIEDGAGTELPVKEIPNMLLDHQINFPQSSGMYNNGYVANIEAGPLLPGEGRRVWPRDGSAPKRGNIANLPGKQGIPQIAGQFVTPGFKQEIPQIGPIGTYKGRPGEGIGPIGTYKGGSFAVPLPYYG